ncbi:hypothetical protein NMY22_g6897 [Coprinellus aureogranulatus]|nr:hypothetical protein NMY22_g6897 [Coprinellus aureogranulatus]
MPAAVMSPDDMLRAYAERKKSMSAVPMTGAFLSFFRFPFLSTLVSPFSTPPSSPTPLFPDVLRLRSLRRSLLALPLRTPPLLTFIHLRPLILTLSPLGMSAHTTSASIAYPAPTGWWGKDPVQWEHGEPAGDGGEEGEDAVSGLRARGV